MLPCISGGNDGIVPPAGLSTVFGSTLAVGVGLSGAMFTVLCVFAPSPLVLPALGRGAVALAWIVRLVAANSDKSISISKIPSRAVNRATATTGAIDCLQAGGIAPGASIGLTLAGIITLSFLATMPMVWHPTQRDRAGRRRFTACLLDTDPRQEVLVAHFLVKPNNRFIELNGNDRWA